MEGGKEVFEEREEKGVGIGTSRKGLEDIG